MVDTSSATVGVSGVLILISLVLPWQTAPVFGTGSGVVFGLNYLPGIVAIVLTSIALLTVGLMDDPDFALSGFCGVIMTIMLITDIPYPGFMLDPGRAVETQTPFVQPGPGLYLALIGAIGMTIGSLLLPHVTDEAASAEAVQKHQECPNCRASVPNRAQYCSQCGTVVDE